MAAQIMTAAQITRRKERFSPISHKTGFSANNRALRLVFPFARKMEYQRPKNFAEERPLYSSRHVLGKPKLAIARRPQANRFEASNACQYPGFRELNICPARA